MRTLAVLLLLAPAVAHAAAGDFDFTPHAVHSHGGDAHLTDDQLQCNACVTDLGATILAIGEAGMLAHAYLMWTRPARDFGPHDGDGLAEAGAIFLSPLELVPVLGPVLGALEEPNDSIRGLLLADLAVQLVGLLFVAVGSPSEPRVTVTPAVGPAIIGANVNARF